MLVEQAGISKAEPIHRDLGMGQNPGVAQKVFALVNCPLPLVLGWGRSFKLFSCVDLRTT